MRCGKDIFEDGLQDVSRQEKLYPGGISQVLTLLVFVVMMSWKRQVICFCHVEY